MISSDFPNQPSPTTSQPSGSTTAAALLWIVSQSSETSGGDNFVEARVFHVTDGFNPDDNSDYCAQSPIDGFDQKATGTTDLPDTWEQEGWNFDDDWTSCDFRVQGTPGGGNPQARLTCDGMGDRAWKCTYSGGELTPCTPPPLYTYRGVLQCRAGVRSCHNLGR
jgi:hypothetical protein